MRTRDSLTDHPIRARARKLIALARTYHERHWWIAPLVGIPTFIIIIMITQWQPASTPPIAAWQPTPLITQPDQAHRMSNPPTPVMQISARAQPVADGRFEVVVADTVYPGQLPAVQSAFAEAFSYVSGRFTGDTPLSAPPFLASIALDPECELHGITYPDERIVQVFSCTDIALDRATAIMAHEFVHQLEYDRYGPPHLNADVILSEGVATWAAGRYWLGGQADFRSFVRAQRQRGTLLPLATNPAEHGPATLNALYYQWASFVEFLLQRDGRAAFDRLYLTGDFAPGSSDYAGIYGKTLDELEREWLTWLDG